MDGNGKLKEREEDAAGSIGAAAADAEETAGDVAGVEAQRALIAMVRGGDVRLGQTAAAVVTARGGADLNQSASVAVISGGDTSMRMSAAIAAPSLGDVRLEKSAAQWLVSAGDVSLEKSGCAAVVAPDVRVEHSAVGVALARRIEVGEGGRVLLRPLAAAALGIGLGIGLGLAVAVSAGWAGARAWKRRPAFVRRA